MVHMCKMIIYPGIFFPIFQNFDFLGCHGGGWGGGGGVERFKKWPKTTKNYVCRALYFKNHISYDLHLWYASVKG